MKDEQRIIDGMARASQALLLRRTGMTLKQVGLAMGISPGRATQLIAKAEREEKRDPYRPKISSRLQNAIHSELSHLLQTPRGEDLNEDDLKIAWEHRKTLRKAPNFGVGSEAELAEVVGEISTLPSTVNIKLIRMIAKRSRLETELSMLNRRIKAIERKEEE